MQLLPLPVRSWSCAPSVRCIGGGGGCCRWRIRISVRRATFRALCVHVPSGTTSCALGRLDGLIARLSLESPVERLVFLGDFLHAKEGRNDNTFSVIAAWRASHAGIAMQIVRGNHDKRAGDPPASVGVQCVDGPVIEDAFALAHHPVGVPGQYALAGHVHPCAVLTGPARQRERLPCFWFSKARQVGVLPAFGDFTGCAEVDAREGDDIFVVADGSVFRTSSRDGH